MFRYIAIPTNNHAHIQCIGIKYIKHIMIPLIHLPILTHAEIDIMRDEKRVLEFNLRPVLIL